MTLREVSYYQDLQIAVPAIFVVEDDFQFQHEIFLKLANCTFRHVSMFKVTRRLSKHNIVFVFPGGRRRDGKLEKRKISEEIA